MASQTDEIDSGFHSIVFDEEDRERRSWKFSDRSIPRSEVVFLCQITVAVCMILISCINLFFSEHCEDKTIWVAILSSAVGYVLPNPKL